MQHNQMFGNREYFDPTDSHNSADYDIDKSNFRNIRIIQRNIIYVIGIPEEIANENMLTSSMYFGQYGEIIRIVINQSPHITEKKKEKYYSCYITYTTPESACLSIIATHISQVESQLSLQASYATVKFCMFFVKKKPCRIKSCRFYHSYPPKSEIIFDVQELSKKAGTNMALFDFQVEAAFQWSYKSFQSIVDICSTRNMINSVLPSANITINYLYKIMAEKRKSYNSCNSDLSSKYLEGKNKTKSKIQNAKLVKQDEVTKNDSDEMNSDIISDKVDQKKESYTPLKAKFGENKKNAKQEADLKNKSKIKQQQEFELYLKNKFKAQEMISQAQKDLSMRQNGFSEEVAFESNKPNCQNYDQILDTSKSSGSKQRCYQDDNRQFYDIQSENNQTNPQYHIQSTDYSINNNFDQNSYQKNSVDHNQENNYYYQNSGNNIDQNDYYQQNYNTQAQDDIRDYNDVNSNQNTGYNNMYNPQNLYHQEYQQQNGGCNQNQEMEYGQEYYPSQNPQQDYNYSQNSGYDPYQYAQNNTFQGQNPNFYQNNSYSNGNDTNGNNGNYNDKYWYELREFHSKHNEAGTRCYYSKYHYETTSKYNFYASNEQNSQNNFNNNMDNQNMNCQNNDQEQISSDSSSSDDDNHKKGQNGDIHHQPKCLETGDVMNRLSNLKL